jgi:hypothetical protein
VRRKEKKLRNRKKEETFQGFSFDAKSKRTKTSTPTAPIINKLLYYYCCTISASVRTQHDPIITAFSPN